MVSVGIDLHRRRSDLVGVGDVGTVIWKRRIASTPPEFLLASRGQVRSCMTYSPLRRAATSLIDPPGPHVHHGLPPE